MDVVHGLEAVGELRTMLCRSLLDPCHLHLGHDRGHVLFLVASIAVYSPFNPPPVAI